MTQAEACRQLTEAQRRAIISLFHGWRRQPSDKFLFRLHTFCEYGDAGIVLLDSLIDQAETQPEAVAINGAARR